MYICSDCFCVQYMMATDGVFAAGDIARFHLPLINADTNIGHWQLAHNHGTPHTHYKLELFFIEITRKMY